MKEEIFSESDLDRASFLLKFRNCSNSNWFNSNEYYWRNARKSTSGLHVRYQICSPHFFVSQLNLISGRPRPPYTSRNVLEPRNSQHECECSEHERTSKSRKSPSSKEALECWHYDYGTGDCRKTSHKERAY